MEHLKQHAYTRHNEKWEESLTTQLCLRLPKKMKDKLVEIPGWQEQLRDKIKGMIDGVE